MSKKLMILIIIIFIVISSACSKKEYNIKLGKYTANEEFVYLEIEENERFVLSRAINLDYRPNGSYIVDGDRLILYDNDNEEETMEFEIDDDMLIFQAGRLCDEFYRKRDKVYI